MTSSRRTGPAWTCHTAAREVYDVQGAGDTTIAALALALRAGATLLEAAVIANAAAGVVVGKVWHRDRGRARRSLRRDSRRRFEAARRRA